LAYKLVDNSLVCPSGTHFDFGNMKCECDYGFVYVESTDTGTTGWCEPSKWLFIID
jgi:hypothetical protein